MSRSAENILLQVAHVKHKKNEGTLYVMGERIAWMMGGKNQDKFSINHKYADIKNQKISPDGKPKIQLQLVMHDGNSTTFHFVHPDGGQVQYKHRDDVKQLLLRLLPKFKKKVSKELEEKNRMLSENAGLLQLYKDLVITGILTAEEFWAQHATIPSKPEKEKRSSSSHQEVGVSGSFLSDIKPQADGANGLKYNLTSDVIQSIFKTYPAVKRKHVENVPEKLSEPEFWTKFFQSHYFHRDRVHVKGGAKDIFTECAKDDESRIRAQIGERGVADSVANIDDFDDNTNDEHFGGGAASTSSGGGRSVAKPSSTNFVHQTIIKRFNRHSIMVMNVAASASSSAASASEEASQSSRKKRLLEKTRYDDLDDGPQAKRSTLNLAKTDRYLNGPTPATMSVNAIAVDLSVDDINSWKGGVAQSVERWTREGGCTDVLSARSAVSALNDLSPGGTLMKGCRQQLLAEQYPDSVHKDLKLLYGSVSELLRHFWACFPPTTPHLQERVAKMHDTLKKFQNAKVRPFENELVRQYSSGPKITGHLRQMLAVAYKKYSTWQQKFVAATGKR